MILPEFTEAFRERYRVDSLLGEGAMGTVYGARQRSLGRPVAIKFLKGSLLEERPRFLREMRTLSALQHPNILRVFDSGIEGDQPFLVTELVSGRELSQWMREGLLDLPAQLEVLIQLAMALQFAHDSGVVHRDVKPGNVFLEPDRTVKLGDFSLARFLEGGHTVTKEGEIVGTPAYLSPEEAMGEKVGPACDQYSLGVVAFEMVTGDLPFPSGDLLECIQMRLTKEAPRASSRKPGLPPRLDAAIERTLRLLPEDRFPDLRALAVELDRTLSEIGHHERHPRIELRYEAETRPWRRVVAAAGAVGLLSLGVALRLGDEVKVPATGGSASASAVVPSGPAAEEESPSVRELSRQIQSINLSQSKFWAIDSQLGGRLGEMYGTYFKRRLDGQCTNLHLASLAALQRALDVAADIHEDRAIWLRLEEAATNMLLALGDPFLKVRNRPLEGLAGEAHASAGSQYEGARRSFETALSGVRTRMNRRVGEGHLDTREVRAANLALQSSIEFIAAVLARPLGAFPLERGDLDRVVSPEVVQLSAAIEREDRTRSARLVQAATELLDAPDGQEIAPNTLVAGMRWLEASHQGSPTSQQVVIEHQLYRALVRMVAMAPSLDMDDVRLHIAIAHGSYRTLDLKRSAMRDEAKRQRLELPAPAEIDHLVKKALHLRPRPEQWVPRVLLDAQDGRQEKLRPFFDSPGQ